jgi:hypothetical protein
MTFMSSLDSEKEKITKIELTINRITSSRRTAARFVQARIRHTRFLPWASYEQTVPMRVSLTLDVVSLVFMLLRGIAT